MVGTGFIFCRSLLFNLAFFAWSLVFAVLALPLVMAPPPVARMAGAAWSRGVLWLARVIAGIHYEIRGLDRIPAGPVIFAAKHQSAWDTIFFPARFGVPALVAKRELRLIPLYGWYAWRAGMIWVDRSARGAALRSLIRQALDALKAGRSIVIFPQGTRTPPGAHHVYHPGVAALYAGTNAPVVPVALNSGLFWGRRAFLKRPGTIVVEFLEPTPRGLRRDDFLDALADAIEPATRRLEAETRKPVSAEKDPPA